ncbi:MAG: hypothetical protein ER33_15140 [Cyanobium sp. CACIAM 14]|nr:MAG: hypothetical protein ER33_15140 [Cyanobium sp. CACIAM 14]
MRRRDLLQLLGRISHEAPAGALVPGRSPAPSDFRRHGIAQAIVLPRSGPAGVEAFCFAAGPMECELCGPWFDTAESTLFLVVQHPGEDNSTRSGPGSVKPRPIGGWIARGGAFEQLRREPLGSNSPSGMPWRAATRLRRS